MGFTEPESTITVRFNSDHRYHGLEARLRSLSIAEYAAGMGWDDNEPWTDGQTMARFFEALVSWNLTDRETGQPVPVSDAKNRDQRLIRALNNAWIQGLMWVADSDPLPETSPSGETYPAVSEIPTEPLYESQAS